MLFRQSLMKYSQRYDVSRASRKYNQARSYIYFWLKRWDGTVQSLAAHSKRPNHHPNEHTPEEIALIKRYRRRNPQLEVTELWHRLKKARLHKTCGKSDHIMKLYHYTAINEFTRLSFLYGRGEQSTCIVHF